MGKTDERCTRDLAEQYVDPTGAIRRTDHPRNDLARLDLLSDELLDRYRAAHPESSAAAFDLYEEVERRCEEESRLVALRDALEHRAPQRPILAVAVCLSCGCHAIVRAARSWPVDRAMRRAGLSEREALDVRALIVEAWAEHGDEPPSLDDLASTELHELRAVVGKDADLGSLRDRYGLRRSPRAQVR